MLLQTIDGSPENHHVEMESHVRKPSFLFFWGGVQFGIAFVPETLVEHITCVVFWVIYTDSIP